MTLRQKLFLAFLFVVIIPITLLGMIIIELIMTSSDKNIADTVDHELAMVQTQLQRQSEALQLGMIQAATTLQQSALSPPDQINWQQLLQDWQQIHPQTDFWLIVDRQGQIMAQSPPTYFPVFPFAHLYDDMLAADPPVITTELLTEPGTDHQELVQVTLIPFGLGGASTAAIMAIDRLENNLWPMPPQTGLSHGGSSPLAPLIFLTRHNKIVATSATELTASQILSSEIQEVIDLTIQTRWGFQGLGDIDATTYQLAGEPIFDSQRQIIGALFVGLPYRRYFGLQAQTGWIVTTMLIFSGVISLITASLIASAITQPIQNLIEKSGLLAAGDLSVRASVYGQDEIARLGHAFNKMATNLETSYEAIEQERRRILAIIEASADGIWVVSKNPDGSRGVTMVNSALERMTGQQRNQLIGKQCNELMGVCNPQGKSICAASCPFTQLNQANGIVHGLLPAGNGQETPVEISCGRLTNRRGELTGLVHIMRDLTLRREVEQLKAEFISMVSHELRTPLGHIKGFAGTLLQTDVTWDVEMQRDFLGSIDREVDRLTKLVENLLQMSRIEAGGLKSLERHFHQVDELIELTLPELQQRSDQHHLEINVPPEAGPLPILADIRGLELVLVNLVENAAKYSPPHSTITLWVESNVDQVTFHVQDEGPGIAQPEQSRIFDRFYRIKSNRQGVSSGTGLGLAICKRMVEAHEGRMWVTSQPNQGACFSFSLPVCPAQEGSYV